MSIKKINLLPHKNNYFQKQIKKPTLSDKFKQKLSLEDSIKKLVKNCLYATIKISVKK